MLPHLAVFIFCPNDLFGQKHQSLRDKCEFEAFCVNYSWVLKFILSYMLISFYPAQWVTIFCLAGRQVKS
jgi:hypothetical protein